MIDSAKLKKKLEDLRIRKAAERLGARFCGRCGKEYDPEEQALGTRVEPMRLYRKKFCSVTCWDAYWRDRTRLHMGLDE